MAVLSMSQKPKRKKKRTTGKSKSAMEWHLHEKKGMPGPGQYTPKYPNLKRKARVHMTSSRNATPDQITLKNKASDPGTAFTLHHL